jgi:hypothetical protein
MRMDALEACPPRQPGRPSSDAVSDRGYNTQVKSVGIFHVDLCLKLVRAVRAENEFELQENGIDLPIREEEIRFQEIVIVLQAQF